MTGVYVGRFCPIHKGHERVIAKMIAECGGIENVIVIIGSMNAPQSLRYFFTYRERKGFIKKLFPGIRVVGLPDFNSDDEWLEALDDILGVANIAPKEAVFYGGCEEDIRFFLDDGRDCRFLNRFTSSIKVSATEVRDHLIHGRDKELAECLNPEILGLVMESFTQNWEDFKRR